MGEHPSNTPAAPIANDLQRQQSNPTVADASSVPSTTLPGRDQTVSPESKEMRSDSVGSIDRLSQERHLIPPSQSQVLEGRKDSAFGGHRPHQRTVDDRASISTGGISPRIGIEEPRDDSRGKMDMDEPLNRPPSSGQHNLMQENIRPCGTPSPSRAPSQFIEVNPYRDLRPENQASLDRFVSMLRNEEAAADEAKYKIFKAFLIRENRIRTALYGVDPEESRWKDPSHIVATKSPERDASLQTSTTTGVTQQSLISEPEAGKERSEPVQPTPSELTVQTTTASHSPELLVDQQADRQEDYSPGGRPLISKQVSMPRPSHQTDTPAPGGSPSDSAPIPVNDVPQFPARPPLDEKADPVLRPETATPDKEKGPEKEPVKFEPARPAYLPFRYAQDVSPNSGPTEASKPPAQGYSALRDQGVASGRILAPGVVSGISPEEITRINSPSGKVARQEHEEAFLGLIREKSHAYRLGNQVKPPPALAISVKAGQGGTEKLSAAVTALEDMIPTTMPLERPTHESIARFRKTIGEYPNHFSWIPDIVVQWDQKNREVRKQQEEARQVRQEESSSHIDAMFDKDQIGYGDIKQLEAEFRLAEANRRYEEDVQELESFTEGVFQQVTDRLSEEMTALQIEYTQAMDMLDQEAESGLQWVYGRGNRPRRSDAMSVVLAFFERLQIRYIKLAGAHDERERRRKRLELSVLQVNGDATAIQQLEQKFRAAASHEALHQARERNRRTNTLMDIFDRATVRGLGDNQEFIDEAVGKLRRLDELLVGETGEQAQALATKRDILSTLRTMEELVDLVAHDSRRLLGNSNTADNVLNQADYEVSVREARVAQSSEEEVVVVVLRQLAEEKKHEDERIQAEIDTRISSVSKGPELALSLVKSTRKRFGGDPLHQGRVQKALEAAKLRNAAKVSTG